MNPREGGNDGQKICVEDICVRPGKLSTNILRAFVKVRFCYQISYNIFFPV